MVMPGFQDFYSEGTIQGDCLIIITGLTILLLDCHIGCDFRKVRKSLSALVCTLNKAKVLKDRLLFLIKELMFPGLTPPLRRPQSSNDF